jgi:hypothetical protein
MDSSIERAEALLDEAHEFQASDPRATLWIQQAQVMVLMDIAKSLHSISLSLVIGT